MNRKRPAEPYPWKLFWRMDGDESPTRWCPPLSFATRAEAEEEMARRKAWWPRFIQEKGRGILRDVAEYRILPADQYPD